MERLDKVIGQYLGGLGIHRKALQSKIFFCWPKVVGDFLARRTQPVDIISGTLIVEVDSGPWAHQLTLMKRDIIDKANQALDVELRDIRFLPRGRSSTSDLPRLG